MIVCKNARLYRTDSTIFVNGEIYVTPLGAERRECRSKKVKSNSVWYPPNAPHNSTSELIYQKENDTHQKVRSLDLMNTGNSMK